jgi:hypothetical protein
MFLTQIWGTILGGFINYAVMISIVAKNKEVLNSANGSNSWSGATLQAYNTNATSWALASYLYKMGGQYWMVPIGIAIGAAAVVVHRIFYQVSNLKQNTGNMTNIHDSSSPRSADLTLPISTCPSLSSTLATFPTI